MTQPKIKYPKDSHPLFTKTLQSQVTHYFTSKEISTKANGKAYLKATIIFLLLLILYGSILFSDALIQLYWSYFLLGPVTVFLALNVGHDAAHNSFSKYTLINKFLVRTFDLIGANSYLWKVRHIHSHHTFPNVPGMDSDIGQSDVIRIFPNSPFRKFHAYQHYYMPGLYMIYTLHWLLFRDFKDIFGKHNFGMSNTKTPRRELLLFFIGKSIYCYHILFLPWWLTGFSWISITGAYLLLHLSTSMTITLALVSAHIGEDAVFPEADKDGMMPHSFMLHQLATTVDFATNSIIITHLFGGFNHHVVHHLFPNICHIHYPALTKIVKQTCEEFKVPYLEKPTLWSAIKAHYRLLIKRSKDGRGPVWINEH